MADLSTADLVALITAGASAIVAIIGAIKGTQAQAHSEANTTNLSQLQSTLNQHAQQLHQLALNSPAPSNSVSDQIAQLRSQVVALATTAGPGANTQAPTPTPSETQPPAISYNDG